MSENLKTQNIRLDFKKQKGYNNNMTETKNSIMSSNNNLLYTSFGELSRIIPKVVKARFPVLLRGPHGIGKSEFVGSLAPVIQEILELDKKPVLLDRRLSQCADAGDIIGIPVVDGRATEHKPMKWFAQACDEPCIIMADEIDRAMIDVRQSFFEVGDSRKLHGHHLHKDTVIFSACNGSEHNDGTYQVTNFDPAELNRWWVADVVPRIGDWVEWANKNSIHSQVVDFCKENSDFWYWKGDLVPNRVYPTPRSWARLSRTLEKSDLEDRSSLLLPLCTGFIGKEAAVKFVDYLETYNTTISAEDIIDRGNIYKVKNLDNIQILDLGKRIMARKDVQSGSMGDKQLHNFSQFLQAIPAENFAKIWNEYCMLVDEPGVRRLKEKFESGFLVKVYTGQLVFNKE